MSRFGAKKTASGKLSLSLRQGVRKRQQHCHQGQHNHAHQRKATAGYPRCVTHLEGQWAKLAQGLTQH
jgi:hypothetical protein